jgi:cell division protein FtsB
MPAARSSARNGEGGLRGTAARAHNMRMSRSRSARSLILSAAVPTVAILVVIVFAGFALLGSNGLLSLGGYRKQLAERRVELAQQEGERARLANQKALIERGDPDFADELVRRNTDMLDRNEYMIVPR